MEDIKPKLTAVINEVIEKYEILQIRTPEGQLLCYQPSLVGEDFGKVYWDAEDEIEYDEDKVEGVGGDAQYPCHVVRTSKAKVETSVPTTSDDGSDKVSQCCFKA